MKFSGQDSLALSADARKIRTRVGEQQSIPAMGAKVLDAMGELGKRIEFERLVKSHLDSTTRLALRLTGRQDLAEELVQETMLRAIRNWESFRHQAQFKTWLYRILINAFRDQLRRNPKSTFEEIEPQNCVGWESSAEQKAEASELHEIVSQLISRLPGRQREVLVLSTYDSLSTSHIAEALNITVANVHSNLSAARRKLKQQLAKYLDDD